MQTQYLRTHAPLALLPVHLRTSELTRLPLSSLAHFLLQAAHALPVEAGEVRSAWVSADGSTLAYGDASVCRVQVLNLLCFYWYKSTNTDARSRTVMPACAACRYSVYLLYWYKSTNTDARVAYGDAVRFFFLCRVQDLRDYSEQQAFEFGAHVVHY